MPFALIFIFAAVVFLFSAVAIVGLATVMVFNLLGFFWGSTAFLAVTCVYLSSIAWTWRDARRRGKPSWAAVLLVALCFWPCGLLMWLLFRPEKNAAQAGQPTNFTPSAPPVIN